MRVPLQKDCLAVPVFLLRCTMLKMNASVLRVTKFIPVECRDNLDVPETDARACYGCVDKLNAMLLCLIRIGAPKDVMRCMIHWAYITGSFTPMDPPFVPPE